MQHLLSFKTNSDLPRLTLKEIEIIKLLNEGLNSAQMADKPFCLRANSLCQRTEIDITKSSEFTFGAFLFYAECD